MTSMRMRILSCVSLVDLVLVCSVAVHWWGGGGWGWVMTSMRMRLLCCVSLLVLCFVHWWGGGDGCISHRFLRCFLTTSGQHCADPRMYLTSVQGWGGGVMTSMRMRLTCTVSLSALCIGEERGDWGDVDDVDVVLHDVDCLCER